MNIINYKNYKIEIMQDSDSESPRDWDNIGHFVMFHTRYNFGDEHNFASIQSLYDFFEENKVIYLPVYMYEHSGITINTTGFSCPWDSGKIGYIYVTYEKALKEFNQKIMSDKLKNKIYDILKSEIKTLDQFLRGEIYGFVISKENHCDSCNNNNNEMIESCFGFYDYDYCIEEAKAMIDYHANDKGIIFKSTNIQI